MDLFRKFKKFHNDQEAATAVEYAVLLTLIVLVAHHAINLCGVETAELYQNLATTLNSFFS